MVLSLPANWQLKRNLKNIVMSLRTKVIKYPDTSPLVRIMTVNSRLLQALLCYLYSELSRRPIAAYPSNWLLVYVQCTIHAHPLQNSLPHLFFPPFFSRMPTSFRYTPIFSRNSAIVSCHITHSSLLPDTHLVIIIITNTAFNSASYAYTELSSPHGCLMSRIV